MKIDFVVTWVDGNDPEWRKEKNKHLPTEKLVDAAANRYRDMGTLRYWFRAVEKYAPWVNKVHFITWGHLPEWLNRECPKLNIVNHKDYIPEEFLPTFSSRPIELNMHRIEGLSEHFVYFNDDVFLNAPIDESFFFKKGLPCDCAHIVNVYFENTEDMYAHGLLNSTNLINKKFSYIKSFFKHPAKFINVRYGIKNNLANFLKLENTCVFSGFEEHHLAIPCLKQTLEDLWNDHEEEFCKTSNSKFRAATDITSAIIRYRQFAEGKFSPVSRKSRGKTFSISEDNSNIIKAISSSEHKVICINDSPYIKDFEKAESEIIEVYEKKLPEKSEFEL